MPNPTKQAQLDQLILMNHTLEQVVQLLSCIREFEADQWKRLTGGDHVDHISTEDDPHHG